MSGKIDRGGISTNIDLKEIAPEKRKQIETEERAADTVDEAIKEARERGGDAFKILDQNEIARGNKVDVLHKDLRRSHREMGNEMWSKPRALIVDPSAPGGFSWDLDPRDIEMVAEGRRCPNCLQEVVPGPRCEWRYGNSSEVKGCGYSSIVDDVFPWDR